MEYIFIFVVSLISYFANSVSFIYLNDDKKRYKFIILLNWFTMSMIFFIVHYNCITFIISWELLGLTSYFLISHYENPKAFKSGMSAFFFNRISDCFVLVSIVLLFMNKFSTNIDTATIDNYIMFFICVSLAVASFIKSAVVLYKWLPDSMEAPLPASALIHSATLVSAGIYLNIRYGYIYIDSTLVEILSVITALCAVSFAFIASKQTDIKKTLAYSTIANCSFIYWLLFSKNPEMALLYFAIHGFFKSSVFISFAYSIIIKSHQQDVRLWNQLFSKKNFEVMTTLIPFACLAGLQVTPVYAYKHFI